MENNQNFTSYAASYVAQLRKEGRHSTAHVYEKAFRSFTTYLGTSCIPFFSITRECLRGYGQYLCVKKLKPNTVSTYMRMLRSIYNKGVEAGVAPYVPRLFHEVYTGVDVRQKKALPISELHKLFYGDPGSELLRHTQAVAFLLFQFCGMSFSDFAHLEKSALQQGLLRYERIKTHTPVSLEVLDSAKALIERLRSHSPSSSLYSDYLFAVLSGVKDPKSKDAYREYQSALRKFNNRLKSLARKLKLNGPVTSYTFRHSWATIAKQRGVPVEMISEALGHTSIKTTQIYLKGFELCERTRVNAQNISYVKKCKDKK